MVIDEEEYLVEIEVSLFYLLFVDFRIEVEIKFVFQDFKFSEKVFDFFKELDDVNQELGGIVVYMKGI